MFLCAALFALKLFLCNSRRCDAPTLSEDLSDGQQAPGNHHVLQLGLELLANPKVCNCRQNISKFVSLAAYMSVFVTVHPDWRTYASLWRLSGCSSSGVCIQPQAGAFLHLRTFACRGRQKQRDTKQVVSPGASSQPDDAGSSHSEETLSIQTGFFFQSCCGWHIILHILPGKTESPCHNDKHRINLQLYGVHLSSCWVFTRFRCGLKSPRGSKSSLSTGPRTH